MTPGLDLLTNREGGRAEGFSICGDEASQDTVAVVTLGLGITSTVMHRIGDDVRCEVARELDQLKETSGCFCTERIGDSILGI